jgi:hypothetical protein
MEDCDTFRQNTLNVFLKDRVISLERKLDAFPCTDVTKMESCCSLVSGRRAKKNPESAAPFLSISVLIPDTCGSA